MAHPAEKAQDGRRRQLVTLYAQAGSRVGVCVLGVVVLVQLAFSFFSFIRLFIPGSQPPTFRMDFSSLVAWKCFHRQSGSLSPR